MRKFLRIFIWIAVLAVAAICVWSFSSSERSSSPPVSAPQLQEEPQSGVDSTPPNETDSTEEAPDPPALSEIPEDEKPSDVGKDADDSLPVGKLVITPERRDYVDGALTLQIPKLSVTRLIYSGTGSEQLGQGVGLFDYAQLPGEGNRNVSLAGHRNGRSNGVVNDHAPFYYIDTLETNDYLYVYDSKTIYRYLYSLTDIIEADDWSYIRTTGESVLTLVSCHPIGISDHRIVVRAVLDEIIPYQPDYDFPAFKEVSE